MTRINMNSENAMTKDNLISLEIFFDDISLSDLLVVNKISHDEINRRINIIDKRKNQ